MHAVEPRSLHFFAVYVDRVLEEYGRPLDASVSRWVFKCHASASYQQPACRAPRVFAHKALQASRHSA
jgi:hypothetical protein